MKQKIGIIAVLFVIAGFGMIHGKSPLTEIVGISLIGLGTLYLLYLLISSKPRLE